MNLLEQIAATPDDLALRLVYADALEEAGDARAEFVRWHVTLCTLSLDHAARPEVERRLVREGIDPAWLEVIERIGEAQDRHCAAWRRLEELIARAAEVGQEELTLRALSGPERLDIVTLPASIGSLTGLRRLSLGYSRVSRLPPEMGRLAALQELEFSGSALLRWLPHEMMRLPRLLLPRDRGFGRPSERELPHLAPVPRPAGAPEPPPTHRACSVCGRQYLEEQLFRGYLRRDELYLVNACSGPCLVQA